MTMLADLVGVVIGVDTHSQTYTSAVVDARTGGALARATVLAANSMITPAPSRTVQENVAAKAVSGALRGR